MDERECLAKAQEAEAFADAAATRRERLTWEKIAAEFRKLARVAVDLRRIGASADPSDKLDH